MGVAGGMPGKHKEIRQELREWEEIWKSGGKEHPQAARFCLLLGGEEISDQNQRSVSGPILTSDLHDLCPWQPGTREKALAVMVRTARAYGAAGRSGGGTVCAGEENTWRRSNECIKISLAHPQKSRTY